MTTQAQYSWQPTLSRVVFLDARPCQTRGYLIPPAQPSWPVKDPGDTLDFVVDISGALIGNEGDAIATLDIEIFPANPGDLTLVSSSADGVLAILWLAAGFAGTVYQVTLSIGTNSGRILSRTVTLAVQALATPPVSEAAITDQSGAPITDQYSNPITVD